MLSLRYFCLIIFILAPLPSMAQFAPLAMRKNSAGSSGNFWSSMGTTGAPTARSNHSAVWTGTRMIVWGGHNGASYLNTGAIYNPAADSWTATSTLGTDTNAPPSGRTDHSAVWTDDRMIIWGGYEGNTGTYLNNGAKY